MLLLGLSTLCLFVSSELFGFFLEGRNLHLTQVINASVRLLELCLNVVALVSEQLIVKSEGRRLVQLK